MSKTNLGGQHHINLFGLPGSSRFARRPVAAPKADAVPRKVDGKTFTQRRSVLRSRMDAVVATFANAPVKPLSFAPSMETLMVLSRARIKREKEEAATRAKATPDMLARARAVDMREAYPNFYEDERVTFSPGRDEVGYTEFSMAND